MPDELDEMYPEHRKLTKIADKSQAIGEFMDWLGQEKGYTLAKWSERENELVPQNRPIRYLLAEYFDIDENKIEAEKRQMLQALRESASKR